MRQRLVRRAETDDLAVAVGEHFPVLDHGTAVGAETVGAYLHRHPELLQRRRRLDHDLRVFPGLPGRGELGLLDLHPGVGDALVAGILDARRHERRVFLLPLVDGELEVVADELDDRLFRVAGQGAHVVGQFDLGRDRRVAAA